MPRSLCCGVRRRSLTRGGPSALLFSVLHPERASSLTLIPCCVASSAGQDQVQTSQKGGMWVTIFEYDSLFWAITKLFKRQLMELMGADDAVIAGLTPVSGN